MLFFDRWPDCPISDGTLAGTFGDRPLKVTRRGGKYSSSCWAFTLEVPIVEPVGDTRIEIRDATLTMAATFPADALAPRRATLRSHPSWDDLRAGETIVVDWSPASDLVDGVPEVLIDAAEVPVTLVDGQLTFVAPNAGASFVVVGVRTERALATDCVNAASCYASHRESVRYEVTVAP